MFPIGDHLIWTISLKKSTHEICLGMTEFVQPVTLCGGSGTRLWPLSHAGFPKQLLCMTGAESLFQQAVQRMVSLGSTNTQVAKSIIVNGEDQRAAKRDELVKRHGYKAMNFHE